ncbi:hypothetical protein AAL_07466 [Moelleriella libera RCEF 2490]|uniref:Uncharacterized protein n=1 Tax=Moelleriella libera RCEF 2490 TaxID=1081109 RepID=A0A167XDU9_9HYPO|nr:hypothetical protein AAL_07466 [Moelleriella libera RCEF 2490]
MAAPASGADARPLAFAERLHPLVFLYRPQERPTSAIGSSRLIVVAGWTDARDVHVARTSCGLPPSARPSSTPSPVIRAAFPTSPAPGHLSAAAELLIHMPLNGGGSSTVANLYEQYAAAAFFFVGLSPVQRLLVAPFFYAWSALWSLLMVVGEMLHCTQYA